MKKVKKTYTQTVIDYLIENKIDTFTIQQLCDAFPEFKTNTMSTLVSRDLKKRGLITKTNNRIGMKVIYSFNPDGKPAPEVKKVVTKLRKGKHLKPETDSYDSYVKIGKAIEQLLEDKNQRIYNLEAQLQSMKKQLMDSQATVQERDHHIVEQGNKIHELSEKIRNKSGGSIKLDELQSIVNG
jgi:hypothetical protein